MAYPGAGTKAGRASPFAPSHPEHQPSQASNNRARRCYTLCIIHGTSYAEHRPCPSHCPRQQEANLNLITKVLFIFPRMPMASQVNKQTNQSNIYHRPCNIHHSPSSMKGSMEGSSPKASILNAHSLRSCLLSSLLSCQEHITRL